MHRAFKINPWKGAWAVQLTSLPAAMLGVVVIEGGIIDSEWLLIVSAASALLLVAATSWLADRGIKRRKRIEAALRATQSERERRADEPTGELCGKKEEELEDLFNSNSEIGMGSTGDPPVPSGHWPDGTGRALALATAARKSSDALPIPSGGSPLGTGQWPVLPAREVVAASEFGFKCASIESQVFGPDGTILRANKAKVQMISGTGSPGSAWHSMIEPTPALACA